MECEMVGCKDLGIYAPEKLHPVPLHALEILTAVFHRWTECNDAFLERLGIHTLLDSHIDQLAALSCGIASDGKLVMWVRLNGHVLAMPVEDGDWRYDATEAALN